MQPATTAVLVIDMQNDTIHPDGAFAATGAAEHAASQNVIGNVRAVLDAARTAVIPVFHNVIVVRPNARSAATTPRSSRCSAPSRSRPAAGAPPWRQPRTPPDDEIVLERIR